MIVVPDAEGAGLDVEVELKFPLFQDLAVVIAQKGNENFAAQFRLRGKPVDVEILGVR